MTVLGFALFGLLMLALRVWVHHDGFATRSRPTWFD